MAKIDELFRQSSLLKGGYVKPVNYGKIIFHPDMWYSEVNITDVTKTIGFIRKAKYKRIILDGKDVLLNDGELLTAGFNDYTNGYNTEDIEIVHEVSWDKLKIKTAGLHTLYISFEYATAIGNYRTGFVGTMINSVRTPRSFTLIDGSYYPIIYPMPATTSGYPEHLELYCVSQQFTLSSGNYSKFSVIYVPVGKLDMAKSMLDEAYWDKLREFNFTLIEDDPEFDTTVLTG